MSKLELTDKHGKVYLVEERCAEEKKDLVYARCDTLKVIESSGISGLYITSSYRSTGMDMNAASFDALTDDEQGRLIGLGRYKLQFLRDTITKWLGS